MITHGVAGRPLATERLRLAGVTKRLLGPRRAGLGLVHDTAWADRRLSGPERRGQDHHVAHRLRSHRADEGSIEIDGRDPRADGGRALSQVGVLIETPGILPYVHGSDLLESIASVRGISRADRPGAIRRAAERLEVTDQLARPMSGLSTGLTRRVLLAGAILGDPPLLLLDEPTLGLDPAARASLRRVLRDLRADGRSILLSTHLLDDVEEVCDRVLFLRDGRLVGDEPDQPEGTDRPPTARRSLRDPAAPPGLHLRLGR